MAKAIVRKWLTSSKLKGSLFSDVMQEITFSWVLLKAVKFGVLFSFEEFLAIV